MSHSATVANLNAEARTTKMHETQQLRQAQAWILIHAAIQVCKTHPHQAGEREATAALASAQQQVAHLRSECTAAQLEAESAHASLVRMQAQHAQHGADFEHLKRQHEYVFIF